MTTPASEARPAPASEEAVLSLRLARVMREIDAATRERRSAPVRAARLRLAAVHGAKRLRRRLETGGRAA